MAQNSNKYTRNAARTTFVGAVISIGLMLCMLGYLGWLVFNMQKVTNQALSDVVINVYVAKGEDNAEVNRLKKKLDAEPFASSVRLIDPGEAAVILQEDLGHDFVEFVGHNPLPYTLELRLKAAYTHPDSIKQVLEAGFFDDNYDMIDEVKYPETLLDTMVHFIRNFSIYLLVGSALLLLTAIVLIHNTIRLNIYSKRFTIKTMQLVGATSGFIRRPFLSSGILQGIYGGLLAWLFIGALIYGTVQLDEERLRPFVALEEIAVLLVGVMLLGILISWGSTALAVRRYIRLKSEDLY